MSVRLFILDGGTIEILDWSIYDPGSQQGTHRTLANPVYLVVHDQGTLVWDSGLDDSLIEAVEPVIVAGHAVFKVANSVQRQLEDLGHPADSIDFFAPSHFHTDHVGNAGLFAKAVLISQRDEYDAAFGPDAESRYYDPALYSKLAHAKVNLLDGDLDVFGDGTVVVKRFPGHTVGNQSLLVRLESTGPVLISGDLTHSMSNWEARAIPPNLNFDPDQSALSLQLAEELLEKEGATLWVQHDHGQYQELVSRGGPYE